MQRSSVGRLAAIGVLLATAACGGSSGAGSASGAVASTAPTGGASAGAVSPGGAVKIGAILSLSGVYSTLGPPEKNAITMGLEALNKGGFVVDGKKYTMDVTIVDDKSDAATTGVSAFRQMTQSDKLPLIGFGLGSSTYAPLLKRSPIPMVNILDSTFPSILKYDPHLFLTRGDSPTYVPGCLDYARTKLGVKSVSIITAKGEPYAQGLTDLVKQSAPGLGLTVGATAEYPLGATDYGNAIRTAVASKPDAVYLSSVTAVILPVLKQLRQSGFTGPVLHSSGVNPNQAEAILGANYNTLMKDNFDCAGTLPTTSEAPATQAFAKAYKARWIEYPQDLTMWAHDFPFVVAEAMTKAGSTSDPDKIFKALPEINVPKGTISGWIAGDKGTLFTERGARTSSEVTPWCPDKKTIASAMTSDTKDGKVVDQKVRETPCATAGN